MASAQLNVPFDDGEHVRVDASGDHLTVSLLSRDWDQKAQVETRDPARLRRLAGALNQVADFVEANGE